MARMHDEIAQAQHTFRLSFPVDYRKASDFAGSHDVQSSVNLIRSLARSRWTRHRLLSRQFRGDTIPRSERDANTAIRDNTLNSAHRIDHRQSAATARPYQFRCSSQIRLQAAAFGKRLH